VQCEPDAHSLSEPRRYVQTYKEQNWGGTAIEKKQVIHRLHSQERRESVPGCAIGRKGIKKKTQKMREDRKNRQRKGQKHWKIRNKEVRTLGLKERETGFGVFGGDQIKSFKPAGCKKREDQRETRSDEFKRNPDQGESGGRSKNK